ncbi:MAG: hypothetical protein EOO97_00015 [Pedobacter sp.]|nr:MAG: hypothetical protein EOO97_00015 [Pedobacter sp.]
MKKYFRSLIIASLILTLAPILSYIINFHKTGISKSVADWGVFGDFLGGTVNTIISFLTLLVTIFIALELSRLDDQRNNKVIETSYKPELVIEEKTFSLYTTKGNLLRFEYSYDPLKRIEKVGEKVILSSLPLLMYNIGTGPTKWIKVRFEFDLQRAISLYNKIVQDEPEEESWHISLKDRGISVSEKGNHNREIMTTYVQDFETKINHLVPVSVSNTPFELAIPFHISLIHSYILTHSWGKEPFKTTNTAFPSIYVKLSYMDIGDKTFEKTIKIDFDRQVAFKTDNNTANFQFKLLAEELKV